MVYVIYKVDWDPSVAEFPNKEAATPLIQELSSDESKGSSIILVCEGERLYPKTIVKTVW